MVTLECSIKSNAPSSSSAGSVKSRCIMYQFEIIIFLGKIISYYVSMVLICEKIA